MLAIYILLYLKIYGQDVWPNSTFQSMGRDKTMFLPPLPLTFYLAKNLEKAELSVWKQNCSANQEV